jgi:hypothetical protein
MPTAGFSADPTTWNAPLTITFVDLSQNTKRWKWNFGDELFQRSRIQHILTVQQETTKLPLQQSMNMVMIHLRYR